MLRLARDNICVPMGGKGDRGLGASFGAARSVPTRIEVQQVKASVRERLFGIQADSPRLGEYRVVRRIGRGGMGAVYEAVDAAGEVVALKTLRGFSPTMLYHLKNEFRALAGVTHPNLIGLDKLYVSGTQAYFTMELVDGRDLVRYVRGDASAGVCTPELVERLRGVLPQLVDAVAALHDAGKLHRDLKPSNVLVTAEGRAVVLDFGLVRDTSEVSALSSSNEAFVGTPAYMAPELASGDSLSQDCDWYAVGVMLYEALVGALPFDGGGFQVLLDKCRSAAPQVARRVRGVPEDLAALCDGLLSRDPADRPSLAEIRACVGEPPPQEIVKAPTVRSMIGRDRQFAALRVSLAEVVASGCPGVTCIIGESGIGKSALLLEFMEEMQRAFDARVLSGRCYTSESVPFRALDPLIDGLTRVLVELEPDEAAALVQPESWAMVRLFPVLGRVTAFAEAGEGPGHSTDAAEIQRRAIAGLRRLLGDLAAERPLLLVIDDVQWSDEDSAMLLREILSGPSAPPVLVVLGIRAGRVADNSVLQSLAELEDGPKVEHVELGRLTTDEARALVASLSQVDVDDARLGPLVEEAAGVPLFLVELAHHLRSKSGSAAVVALDQLIRDRLAGLPESARSLLEILAITGRPLAPALAVKAAELGQGGRSIIPRLKAAHLICERSTSGDTEIEIFHERIRAEIIGGISRLRRPKLHRNLALTLSRAGAPASLLALHFRAGGLRPLALRYTIEAGEEAVAELAFRRAVGFFTGALELASVGPELRGIHRRLAAALAYLGLGSESAEHYFAAADGAEPEEANELRRSAALTLLRCGEIERGTTALRGVLREVDESWPGGGTRATLSLAGERLRLRLRGYSYSLCEPGSLTLDEYARLETLSAASEGLSASDPLRAMVFQSRYLRRALAAGDPNFIAPALAGEAAFASHVGGGERVSRLLDESEALLERCTGERPEETWRLCAAVVAFGRGDWRECVEQVTASQELGIRHQGSAYILTMGGFFELNSLFYLGRLSELRSRRAALLSEVDEGGDLCGSTTLRVGMQALLHLADDDWGAARAEVRGAVERWPEGTFAVQRAWAFLTTRAIDLYAGDPADAWRRLSAEWPEFRGNISFGGSYIRIMGRFWRANVALAAVAVEPKSLRVASSELRKIEGEDVAWAGAFAALLRGGIATVRGDQARAAVAYREAIEGFDELDMALWSAASRWRLGRALGDDAGLADINSAVAVAEAQGVVSPPRLFATLAPGL